MNRDRAAVRRIMLAMAYNREQFKNKLVEYCRGACREFYKAQLAEKLLVGHPQDLEHWRKEVDTLLGKAREVIGWTIKGFTNRRQAAMEALAELAELDFTIRTNASNIIKKDYELGRLVQHITDEDTTAFATLAHATINGALREMASSHKKAPRKKSSARR